MMILMKKLTLALLIALCAGMFTFTSCSKEEEEQMIPSQAASEKVANKLKTAEPSGDAPKTDADQSAEGAGAGQGEQQ